MNILFYCPFKFSLESKNIRSLGGIESLNLELTQYLANSKNKIYLASFCNKEFKKKNLINLPISKLKKDSHNYNFDYIVSSNDPNIFNLFRNSKKILWIHNTLAIDRSLNCNKLLTQSKYQIPKWETMIDGLKIRYMNESIQR